VNFSPVSTLSLSLSLSQNGVAAEGGDNMENSGGGFMSGDPIDFMSGEFDFESAVDHFTSNIDMENHLTFFVDTLALIQQKGEEQAVTAGMSQQASQMMQRLVQTHGRMLQYMQQHGMTVGNNNNSSTGTGQF
jgi:hypothetical protein